MNKITGEHLTPKTKDKKMDTTKEQIKIQPYFNEMGWSDINPYEVVEIRTENKVIIRAMDAELSQDWKPNFIPGGFSAHCTNQSSQKWDCKPNPTNETLTIRKNKKGQWKTPDGTKFKNSDKPVKFYDYNF